MERKPTLTWHYFSSVLTVAGLAVACGTPAPLRGEASLFGLLQEPKPATPEAQVAEESEEPEQRAPPLDYEHLLDIGLMLRSPTEGWGAHVMFPLGFGFTEFDLSNVSLDSLATVSLVPTAELIIPLDERWTLLPFVGVGGALQLGDNDLIGSGNAIGLATAGVQAFRFQSFAERYMFVFKAGARYDAALQRRDGVLGDWANVDLGVELRRAFGDLSEEQLIEPGVYAQTFHYVLPIELDITGVTPERIDDQHEFGVSLGTSTRFEILGIVIPRVYVGYRFGDGLSSIQIRFGRL